MTTRPITQDDINAAQRGLRMVAMSLADLRDVIEQHKNDEMFAGQVLAIAAQQMLTAKQRMGARD